VTQNIMLYATKENLEATMNGMYMALSTPTRLEIWIDGGQPMDMSSRCLVEQSAG
jgi:hypothetical protein